MLFQLAEPIDLRSKPLRQFRLFCQNRAQSLANLLNDCSAVSMVYVNAVAYKPSSGSRKAPASETQRLPLPQLFCEHVWQL